MNKKTLFLFLLIFLLSGCFKKQVITQEQTTTETKKTSNSLSSANTAATTVPTGTSTNKISDEVNKKTTFGKNENQNVKGSCTNIEKTSICTEYIGDFWTSEQIESNCKNLGQVSTEACDNDFIGGCNIAAGTANENTIWYYGRGEANISNTAIKNIEKLCNRNPKAKWIAK